MVTKKDLFNYRSTQKWIIDRLEYIEGQKETINRFNAIITDTPGGSKKYYDQEAESIARLEDYFSELSKKIVEQQKKQQKLIEIIDNIEQPYSNILYKVYILGKTLVEVSDEIEYSYVDTCRKHKKALKIFEKMITNVIE